MPRFVATAPPGLEPVVARELALRGLEGRRSPGAVELELPLEVGAPLAAALRTPARWLLRVAEGPTRTLEDLARRVRGVDWSPLLAPGTPVEVAVSCARSRLHFQDAIARKVAHAVADAVGRPREGRAPQRIQVRLQDDHLDLSLDGGGELLHRRGWRLATAKAPLRENLAAALLLMAGWTGDEALVDPFCGAGTIPIEAARLARGLPPGVDRRYAFQDWPALARWRPSSSALSNRVRALEVPVVGADRDPGALRACLENGARAQVSVDWRQVDLRELSPPAPTGLLVTNPPYGARVGHAGGGAYAALGIRLREAFVGWRVLFLAPRPELAKKVHFAAEELTRFDNGGIPVGVWAWEGA